MQQIKGISRKGGHEVGQSLLFYNSYLSRLLGTVTTFTVSLWVKRAKLGTTQNMVDDFGFNSGDSINFNGKSSASVYRDPSAWMHFVLSGGSLYVNGVLDSTGWTGSINPTSIGSLLDGYLAEFHFIDGQALGPEHFARPDSNGVYNPVRYTGTYGNNGFYLPFEASDIGADSSGNDNDFTPSGLTSDSVVADTPTNNFPTFNTLWSSRGNDRTFLPRDYYHGNTRCFVTGNSYFNQPANFEIPQEGCWYWETLKIRPMADDAHYWQVGVFDANQCTSNNMPTETSPHIVATFATGTLTIQSSYGASVTAPWTSPVGRWVGLQVDFENNEFSVWDSSGKVLGYSMDGYAGQMFPVIGRGGNNAGNDVDENDVNFGQRPFDLVQPEGSQMLCSKNFPYPRVKPEEHFKAVTYSGNSGTQSIITGFKPDLSWFKARNNAYDHSLVDSVRGVDKAMASNAESAESSFGINYTIDSFDSDGFTLHNAIYNNESGSNYVSWNFRAGGDGVANNDGSILSQVSANKDMGFSVVKWTQNLQQLYTIGHGLGKIPDLIITKKLAGDQRWEVYSTPTGVDNGLVLNDEAASATMGTWGSFQPTDKVFMFTQTPGDYIAYCFTNTEMLQVGSYVGNGEDDGPFVSLPFKPAFVLIKSTSAKHWNMYDTARNPFNSVNHVLYPDVGETEYSGNDELDILSNGFKIITTNDEVNANLTYIYLAISEQPFKHARGR